jgi:hypothetical protein
MRPTTINAAISLPYLGFVPDVDYVLYQGQSEETPRLQWFSQAAEPTDAEIEAAAPAAQAAYAAAQADAAAYQSQRTEVASNLTAMRDRLVLIRDAASPTNAQVIQAVRDLAAIELRILNYIRRL